MVGLAGAEIIFADSGTPLRVAAVPRAGWTNAAAIVSQSNAKVTAYMDANDGLAAPCPKCATGHLKCKEGKKGLFLYLASESRKRSGRSFGVREKPESVLRGLLSPEETVCRIVHPETFRDGVDEAIRAIRGGQHPFVQPIVTKIPSL